MSRAGIDSIRQVITPERRRSDHPVPVHETPDRIVLAADEDQALPGRPRVRLFLGSERRHFRAERLFVWSVARYRHPGRTYEIHLLRDLAGFGGALRASGFPAYRFAVPEFAGLAGRALYHDVGRVYRADPARLFDQPMNGHGVLSAADGDPSLMLVDCERMGRFWNRQSAAARSEQELLSMAETDGRRGRLEGSEIIAAPSRRLERHADKAGFLPFTALRPSRAWGQARLALSSRPDGPQLLELLSPRPPDRFRDRRSVAGWLEQVPDPDVPWVLTRLLHLTGELEVQVREPVWDGGGRLRRDFDFWVERLELAGRLEPKARWRLEHRSGPVRSRIRESAP